MYCEFEKVFLGTEKEDVPRDCWATFVSVSKELEDEFVAEVAAVELLVIVLRLVLESGL